MKERHHITMDERVWMQGEAVAQDKGLSLSALLEQLLRAEIERLEEKGPKTATANRRRS